jgi:acetyltransferase-like isoleucine patch superfamily enzyme
MSISLELHLAPKSLSAQIDPRAVVAPDAWIGANCIIHPFVVIAPGVRIADDVEIFPGAYIGKPPRAAGQLSRKPAYDLFVEIGAGSVIGPHAVIYYDVKIGRNTLIGDGASIREQCRIGDDCIISRCVTMNYNVRVGARTKIMDNTHITGNTVIGEDCFISLCVGTTNDNAIGKLPYDAARVRGPIIEDGAAIGAGATILPAIRIGKGAVVGAGAVVSRDVLPDTVVKGVPARA